MKNNQIVYPKTLITVPLCKSGTVENGFKTEVIGSENVFYETSISLVQLERMARRAAHNKSGQCKAGPITVRVIQRSKAN